MPRRNIEVTADFETTTINGYPEVNLGSVVVNKEHLRKMPKTNEHWHRIAGKGKYAFYGISIFSFIAFIVNIDSDCDVIFNNSQGFDAFFIVPGLTKLGYRNYTNEEGKQKIAEENNIEKEDFYFDKNISRLKDKQLKKQFSVLADGNGHIYTIAIASQKEISGRKRRLYIKDNLLLGKNSVSQMGKELAIEAQKKLSKEEAESLYLKYGDFTLKNKIYLSLEELEEDKDFLYRNIQDSYIVYAYREKVEEYFPKNKGRLTAGSTAYREFKQSIGGSILAMKESKGEVIHAKKSGGLELLKLKGYRGKSPVQLKDELADVFLYAAWQEKPDEIFPTIGEKIRYYGYHGGINLVNEDYRGKIFSNNEISTADIKWSYASCMASEDIFPIYEPIKGTKKGYDYQLLKITPLRRLTNDKGLPFIADVTQSPREYLKTLKKGIPYYMDSNEYKRFLKYYAKGDTKAFKKQVEYSFMATKGVSLFGDYVNTFGNLYSNADSEILKKCAKMFPNSLSGKFASKKNIEGKNWNPDDYEWEHETSSRPNHFYLPGAIAITTLGRMKLVDSVQEKFDRVLGGNTDSIFWLGDRKDFPGEIGNYRGLFRWETPFSYSGIMTRPNHYLFRNEEEISKKNGQGIKASIPSMRLQYDPENEKIQSDQSLNKALERLTFEDMIFGTTIPKQIERRRVDEYGIMLVDVDKEIPPIWSYKPLPNQKYKTQEDFEKINQQKIGAYDTIYLAGGKGRNGNTSRM